MVEWVNVVISALDKMVLIGTQIVEFSSFEIMDGSFLSSYLQAWH